MKKVCASKIDLKGRNKIISVARVKVHVIDTSPTAFMCFVAFYSGELRRKLDKFSE